MQSSPSSAPLEEPCARSTLPASVVGRQSPAIQKLPPVHRIRTTREVRLVLGWLRGKTREVLPEYSAVRRTPNRGLPSDLADAERGLAFAAQRQEIERSLREPPRRPQAERPLFVELLGTGQGGVMTMTLPESGAPCLPIFSTPFRAADYIRTVHLPGARVRYLSSSPLEVVKMLRDLRRMRIDEFALDPCPRCSGFTIIASKSVKTADEAIDIWCIWKATELARMDLYLDHARASARAGQLEVARDVAYETVAHVNFEDPRAHLLLGEIAVSVRDRTLLREARRFLQFFGLDSWERRLDTAIRSGSPDFEFAE